MSNKNIDSEIRSQINQFLVSISDLVRQAALQAVQDALGTTGATVAPPARRGPGRPRKGAGAASKRKTPATRKKAAKKPGRRARRSTADVEAVAAKVLAYVKAKPGHRLEEIGRGLKTGTAGLKRPVQVLLAAGKLRTEGQKRGTKYFAGGNRGPQPKATKRAGKKAKRKGAKRVGRKVGKKGARKATNKSSTRTGGKKAGQRGRKDAKVAMTPVQSA